MRRLAPILLVLLLGSAEAGSGAPGPGAYAARVLADRPAGYWSLDEAPGAKVMHARVGPSGRYDATGTVQGVSGLARRFSGAGAFAVIPNEDAWSQPATDALTVEAWVRPEALAFPHEEGSGYVWILGKGSPGEQEWGLRIYGRDNRESPPRENRIAFYAYNPAGGEGAGAYVQRPVERDRWLYLVGELTPEGVKLYENGVLRQGPPAKGTLYANPAYDVHPAAGAAPVRLGTRNFHSFFEGDIDEVAIYPYLLSDAQVRAHFRTALRANPRLHVG